MEQDDISRAIHLSLFEKSDAEQKALHTDVEKILSFVADIQSIDTSTTAETAAKTNIFRDDVVTVPPGAFREQILGQAPNRFKDWFLSKKILS